MAEKDWRDPTLVSGDSVSDADVVEFLGLIARYEDGILQDADADTKIQVEESEDEDKIRFDTGGTERAVLDSTGLDLASGLTYNIGGTAHNHDASYVGKPASPSHLDLLAFITSDWAKVARSWADGDLLYVKDNEGTLEWQNLAKGADGQYLKTDSGALKWAESAKELYFYIHGSSFFEKDTITSADEITLTSFNGVKTLETLTLDGSFSSICQNGFGYKISFTDEAKQASTTFTASRRYIHATLDEDYASGTCYTTATNAVPTTSYTPNLEAPKTPTSIIPYNNTVYFNTKTTGVASSTFYSRNRTYTIYKVLPASMFTLSGLTEYGGIRYIELFDAGDSVKLNNDDNLVFTGTAGQPLEINVSTKRYMFGKDIDYDGITSIEVVSGNPLIVFEKV